MATPNHSAMKAAWLVLSPFFTPCICPFLIICIASYPWRVRHAVSNEKKPMPGLTRRLMNRWSCSIRLLRYFTCLNSTCSAKIPAALSSALALGYAAFLSVLMTRGTDGVVVAAGAVGAAMFSLLARDWEVEPAEARSAWAREAVGGVGIAACT